MSIGGFIHHALQHYEYHRYEESLGLLCSAIDATTKKINPNEKSVGIRVRRFIDDSVWLISYFMVLKDDIQFSSIQLHISNELQKRLIIDIPSIEQNTSISSGYLTLGDVIYYLVRCELIHSCQLPDTIEFRLDARKGFLLSGGDKIIIPTNTIWGLCMTLILHPINKDEKCPHDILLPILICNKLRLDHKTRLNDLWGKIEEVSKNFEEKTQDLT